MTKAEFKVWLTLRLNTKKFVYMFLNTFNDYKDHRNKATLVANYVGETLKGFSVYKKFVIFEHKGCVTLWFFTDDNTVHSFVCGKNSLEDLKHSKENYYLSEWENQLQFSKTHHTILTVGENCN